MRVGFFESAPGHKSMGRLLAFMLGVAGVAVIAVGLAMAVLDWTFNAGATLGQWAGLIIAGMGMEAAGGLLKNAAKKTEQGGAQ